MTPCLLMGERPFPGGRPRREHAVQGDLRDAGVIAALGAVAEHRPEAVRALIRPRRDGDHDVCLHEARVTADGAEPTGRRVRLVVGSRVPSHHGDPGVAAFADTFHTGATWPAIAEKALAGYDARWDRARLAAARARGYDRLDAGTSPWDRAEILTLLTGEPARVLPLESTPDATTRLEVLLGSLLWRGCPALVETLPRADRGVGPYDLHGSHVYEVLSVDRDGRLRLRNPWGADHPPVLDAGVLLRAIRPCLTTLDPGATAPTGRPTVEALAGALARYAVARRHA